MNRNTSTKKITINALLLAIGAMLHYITPSLGLQMQPDFALTMLFIIMIINRGEYKTSLIAGIITGIFTALTTKFPGGQAPNILDKLITVNVMYILMIIVNKITSVREIRANIKNNIMLIIILPLGTLISGSVFLYSAKILVGLPAPFKILFLSVVVPTILINTVAGIFLYGVVNVSIKRVMPNKNLNEI